MIVICTVRTPPPNSKRKPLPPSPHKPHRHNPPPHLQRHNRPHPPRHQPPRPRPRPSPNLPLPPLPHPLHLLITRPLIHRQLHTILVKQDRQHRQHFHLREPPAQTGPKPFAERDVGAFRGPVKGCGGVGAEVEAQVAGFGGGQGGRGE